MTSRVVDIVMQAWETELRESPSPWHNPSWIFDDPRTYRERLDYQPVNHFGEVIPRIVTVRRNLLRLGRSRPRLPQ